MSDSTPTYTPPKALSSDHEIVTVAALPFPRNQVFAAWTHPDLHAKWWGPKGFTNTFYNYDVRTGGVWRFTMHGPDGQDYENHSVFDHVTEQELIVFRHTTAPEFAVVAKFDDDGEGTRLTWHMIFEDAKTCAGIREFVGDKNQENIDRLTAVLNDTPADSPVFRELVLLREMAAPPAAVWRAITTRATEWFCPKPWSAPVVEWELRPGGKSRTVMAGPNGEEMDMTDTILEAVENERLLFTDAFTPGWQPTAEPFMVGVYELSPGPSGGTRYRASARHWTIEARDRHAAMGFRPGWGAVADQLRDVSDDEARRDESVQ